MPTELSIDEENDLDFKINVTGTTSSEPVKTRLVIEADDINLSFNGKRVLEESGVVTFAVPKLVGRVKEGSYKAHVEVIIEGRIFTPVEFEVNLKRPVNVVAEAVVAKPRTGLQVSASPVVVRPVAKQKATPVVKQRVQTLQEKALKSRNEEVEKEKRVSDKDTPTRKLTLDDFKRS